MTKQNDRPGQASRRHFLAGATGLMAMASAPAQAAPLASPDTARNDVEPFWSEHQGGIITPAQNQTYFAAFDLQTSKREDVAVLLRSWTEVAARLTIGQPAAPLDSSSDEPAPDSGDTLGLNPSRLTVTFGFGAGLFVKDGKDRYGLQSQRPAALVDMPRFNGDQMIEGRTGGDLSIQA
jgi:deferrochelatase/peroxidase EfeB